MLYDPKWEKPLPTKPWRKALWQAADYIETRGWWQPNVRSDGADSLCALLAISRVAGNASNKAERMFFRHIEPRWWMRIGRMASLAIPVWNDTPQRSKEEVVHALRTAAYR